MAEVKNSEHFIVMDLLSGLVSAVIHHNLLEAIPPFGQRTKVGDRDLILPEIHRDTFSYSMKSGALLKAVYPDFTYLLPVFRFPLYNLRLISIMDFCRI